MSSPADIARIRARAAEIGLDQSAIEGFLQMDRDTLVIQAALWHQFAIAHQNRHAELELRSGEVIVDLFDLCRKHGITVPDETYEAATSSASRPVPSRI